MLNKKKWSVKKLTTVAILAGLGIPLMYIPIAPVPVAPWLEFDLSDLVVYIAAVIYGPVAAVVVALIKSIAHYFLKGSPVGIPINQLIAFLSSLAYTLPFYYVMVWVKGMVRNNRMGRLMVRIVPLVTGTLSLTVILTFLNYVWLTPLYLRLLDTELPENLFNFVVTVYGPFNFAKGAILSVIFFVLSFRLNELVRLLELNDGNESALLIQEQLN